MVDSVSGVGNLSLANGRPTFFGGQSEIDTESLINSLVAARRLPAVKVEESITENDAKIAAYGDLRSLLEAMQLSAEALRNPPGFFGADSNVFEQKGVFLSGGGTVAASSVMSATASNSAVAGTYDMRVLQLAQAEKVHALTAYSDQALGIESTLDIGLATSSVAFDAESPGTVASYAITFDGGPTVNSSDLSGVTNGTELAAQIQADLTAAGVTGTTVSYADGKISINDPQGRTVTTATMDGSAGTVVNAPSTYSKQTVSIDTNDTIYSIRDKVNALSQQTGVSASVVQTSADAGAPRYELLITANETGYAMNYEPTHVTGGSDAAWVDSTLQAAKTAELEIDGIRVSRTSNSIEDAIEGVALSLFQVSPDGESVNVEIGTDLGGVKSMITAFVDSYNAYRSFVDTHQVVDESGEVSTDAILFGESTLRSTTSQISSDLILSVPGIVDSGTDNVSLLAEIGITMDESNRLVISEEDLDNALIGRLDEVRDLFEFRMQAGHESMAMLEHTGAIGVTDFSVSITPAGDVTTKDDLGNDLGDVLRLEGSSLVGVEGTAFEGLKIFVSSDAVANGEITDIDVKMSQGIGDRMYNSIDTLIGTDGLITSELSSLNAQNEDYADEITAIDVRIEEYRQSLIEKFARMEEALTLSKQLLDQVTAIADSMSGDS